ncbi:MAG: hypothetical protein NW226_19115 [Microscillaceae bacterium]|nr:hypothetical protein [Microscillaceae bacterium]
MSIKGNDNKSVESRPDSLDNKNVSQSEIKEVLSDKDLNEDTLSFTHFKRLVNFRTRVIPSVYIKKFTSLEVENIGGYLIYDAGNYDLVTTQVVKKNNICIFLKKRKFIFKILGLTKYNMFV